MSVPDGIAFDHNGLIPAVIQDFSSHRVLMVGYMNAEAFDLTVSTGRVVFWSRSRQELWRKGDTSGHAQYVRGVEADCDGDALLVQVQQVGVACHTGCESCFDVLSVPAVTNVEPEAVSGGDV
jgi:phosphoribosyl-AMP cyclohydrolase